MLYRLKQVFLQLGMILIVILYSIMFLFFWFVLFLGSFIWKKDAFDKMLIFLFDCIPSILDVSGNNALEQLKDNNDN